MQRRRPRPSCTLPMSPTSAHKKRTKHTAKLAWAARKATRGMPRRRQRAPAPSYTESLVPYLLIRPYEVLSRIANVTVLEVAHDALRVLLQHRHVLVGRLT